MIVILFPHAFRGLSNNFTWFVIKLHFFKAVATYYSFLASLTFYRDPSRMILAVKISIQIYSDVNLVYYNLYFIFWFSQCIVSY